MFVATILCAAATSLSPQSPPIQTLLVSGANNHDWKWTSPAIAAALEETGRFAVTITYDPKQDLPAVMTQHAAGKLDLIVLDYMLPDINGNIVCKLSGTYMGYVDFDGKRYLDVRQQKIQDKTKNSIEIRGPLASTKEHQK